MAWGEVMTVRKRGWWGAMSLRHNGVGDVAKVHRVRHGLQKKVCGCASDRYELVVLPASVVQHARHRVDQPLGTHF